MCGIAGFISSNLYNEEKEAVIGNMLKAIAHRGPDATSSWSKDSVTLGHNRLSIIDLSHQADQPMHYRHCTIVFNGEIYNYLELRAQLIAKGYTFKTQSDTEVIIASYIEWGTTCVSRFVGMWAFALFDKENNCLFVSRDRFGIKPFYYIHKGNEFYFASEYKPLKICPAFNGDLNIMQISRGLQLGWICYDDETYFNEIKALPAAHNMVINLNENGVKDLNITTYWDIDITEKTNISFAEKTEQFYNLFKDSIKLHCRSDVPVATCLSGGLDSSAIASMVQTLNPDMDYKSFSIYYDGKGDVDERPFIKAVIEKYNHIIPYYKKPTDTEVAENFHRALYHCDAPSSGSSFMSQYFLMQLIQEQGIKVVLDGQGSDEYLGGYMHSYYRVCADYIRKGNVKNALQLTAALAGSLKLSAPKQFAHFGKSIMSSLFEEDKLYKYEYNHYYPFITKEAAGNVPLSLTHKEGSKLDSFLYHLLFTTSLPTLLHYEDRNSMAFSIESRVPFLDHRLVEFAFSLSSSDKINGTVTKHILRESLKPVLPQAIYNRTDKKGFVTPGEDKWLRGSLKHLLDIDYSIMPFVSESKIKKILDEYKSGNNTQAKLVWRIAVLNYWLKYIK